MERPMQTWIALFRGINVGGRNSMPMARLRDVLASAGCEQVRTYIQSGNVVFRSRVKAGARLSSHILDAVEAAFGFPPHLLLLTAADLREAVEHNPFPEATADPRSLHFFFLDTTPPAPATAALAVLATATERYRLMGRVFYLHAPDGFGRSRLASSAERKLGVAATARNYATVETLVAMVATS
jgi:uncharacterized protein (DUF1697 family)